MKNHTLKTLPSYFKATLDEFKHYEIRKDDRGFAVGDSLVLAEWVEDKGYTGRQVMGEITHILRDFDGLVPGYVILSYDLVGYVE